MIPCRTKSVKFEDVRNLLYNFVVLSLQAHLLRWLIRAIRHQIGAPIPKLRSQTAMAESLLRTPGGVLIEQTLAGGVPAEWARPKGGLKGQGIVFYLHGGGFVIGSPRLHRPLVALLSRLTGLRALSVDYRLAPEHPFPAALEDVLAAYRWLRQDTLAEEIVFGGDSAGGNLVLAALLALHAGGEALPAAAFCLSPVTDLTGDLGSRHSMAQRDPVLPPESAQWIEAYAPGADLSQPLLSPLQGDLHGLPPLLLQVGTEEILFDDSNLFAEKARQAGVEVQLQVYEGLWHVFQLSAGILPEGRQAVQQIAEFVCSQLSKQAIP